MSTNHIRFLEIENGILAENVEGLSIYYSANGQGYLHVIMVMFHQIHSAGKPKYASGSFSLRPPSFYVPNAPAHFFGHAKSRAPELFFWAWEA